MYNLCEEAERDKLNNRKDVHSFNETPHVGCFLHVSRQQNQSKMTRNRRSVPHATMQWQMMREPLPVRICSSNILLNDIRSIINHPACQDSWRNLNFTQSSQRSNRHIKFEKYLEVAIPGDITLFLLPVFRFANDPIVGMKM